MPEYQYRCDSCNSIVITTTRTSPPPCPVCGLTPKRQWAFNHTKGIQPHYNHSVGAWVENNRQFYDGLKRQSDIQSERTGVSHDFQPVDPADMQDPTAHGVTDEGLEISRKTLHDEGLIQ